MKLNHKPEPSHGDIRCKSYFAWLPVTIDLQTRWLEKVTVKQKYFATTYAPYIIGSWINICFEDE